MPASVIRIGCRVSGLVGPFLPLVPGKSRRSRARLSGTVITSLPDKGWRVYWDGVNKSADHPNTNLKFVRASVGDQLTNLDLESIMTNDYVIDQRGLDCHMAARPTIPATTATVPTPLPIQQIPEPIAATTQQAPSNPPQPATTPTNLLPTLTNNEQTTEPEQDPIVTDVNENEESDPDKEEEEDNFDPMSIIQDIIEDDRNGRHLTLQLTYQREKAALLGTEVTRASSARGESPLTWVVRNDILKEEVEDSEIEHEKVGIRGFDFTKQNVGTKAKYKRINLLDLLIKLWPGDWRKQIRSMNLRIRLDNQLNKASKRNGRSRPINEISEHEFWVWWGIVIAARSFGRKGNMWDRDEPEGCTKKVDLSEFMLEYRHGQIKRYIPYLWADNQRKGNDPWWQFSKAVDKFNENRKNNVLASFIKVMDESMSAYRPQTTKNGNLPHITFLKRKPENLGTEFKVTADAATGIFLFLEIQRGKHPMRDPNVVEYADVLKPTAACTKRMAKHTKREEVSVTESNRDDVNNVNSNNLLKETWLGDSWFSSVPAAVGVAEYGHYIGVLKTAHARYPKTFIETTMQEWPAGSHLLLETKTPEGVDLLAIGYKYNKRKVNCFIATKGAGHTEEGVSYEARWKDNNGNTMSRDVPRPHIISKYFKHCNKVDLGNQSRQHDLKLEKCWITQDGYFRLVTTMAGCCITDAWKGYKHHLPSQHRHKKAGILEFSSILGKDCLENKFSVTPECEQAMNLDVPDAATTPTRLSTEQLALQFSTIDKEIASQALSELTNSVRKDIQAASTATSQAASRNSSENTSCQHHVLINNEDFFRTVVTEKDGSIRATKRRKRGKCCVCDASTSWYCRGCQQFVEGKRQRAWYCKSKKSCESHHQRIAKRRRI